MLDAQLVSQHRADLFNGGALPCGIALHQARSGHLTHFGLFRASGKLLARLFYELLGLLVADGRLLNLVALVHARCGVEDDRGDGAELATVQELVGNVQVLIAREDA